MHEHILHAHLTENRYYLQPFLLHTHLIKYELPEPVLLGLLIFNLLNHPIANRLPRADDILQPMNDTAAYQAFSRATLDLLFREPFYAHVLQNIPRGLTDAVETAAVRRIDGLTDLVFNPTFLLQELDRNTRIGVLKHEVLHLVFRHLDRTPACAAYPRLFNIAADIVVNQYIDPEFLPAGAITLDRFSELELLPDQTVEYYYQRLHDAVDSLDLSDISDRIFESHKSWSHERGTVSDGMDLLARQRMEKLLADAYGAHKNKSHGHLPGKVSEALSDLFAKVNSILDWRNILKSFAQSSARGAVEFTMKRQSRRFGTRPGLRIKRASKLLVAVDTSGSISMDELRLFFSEIDAIHHTGAHIHIAECDSKVQRDYPYRGKPPASVMGRGGTDFDPVFEFINRSVHRFDGCIYLTDGYAASPEIRPRCRLLWVLTSNGISRNLDFGRHIRISDRA
jgi:predicted metal-dependent peptidase